MKRPKRQHFIAQVHLRAFAADPERKQIWFFDTRTDELKLTAIANAAVQGDYYTVATETGKDTTVESMLQSIETDGARAMDWLRHRIAGALELDATRREWLVMYLALQYTRVPTMREQFLSLANFSGSVDTDILLSNAQAFLLRAREQNWAGSDSDIERERRRYLKEFRSGQLVVAAPEQLTLLPMLQGALMIAEQLREMRWFVFKRLLSPQFVIGDCPVTLWKEDRKLGLGIGFGTLGVEVAMPLSPDTAICGAKDLPIEIVHNLDEADAVQEFNARTWTHSSRFVYAASRSDLLAARDALGDELARKRPSTFNAHVGPPEWKAYARNAPLRPARKPKR